MSLGSDVGAGTSLSMLKTMADAYKVGQLLDEPLSAMQGFYMATLGNARAMRLDDKIGSLKAGKEADFIVLNTAATPLLQHREKHCQSLEERLFMLMTLGDDRCIQAVWVNGENRTAAV
jgi:guanine deaminase